MTATKRTTRKAMVDRSYVCPRGLLARTLPRNVITQTNALYNHVVHQARRHTDNKRNQYTRTRVAAQRFHQTKVARSATIVCLRSDEINLKVTRNHNQPKKWQTGVTQKSCRSGETRFAKLCVEAVVPSDSPTTKTLTASHPSTCVVQSMVHSHNPHLATTIGHPAASPPFLSG